MGRSWLQGRASSRVDNANVYQACRFYQGRWLLPRWSFRMGVQVMYYIVFVGSFLRTGLKRYTEKASPRADDRTSSVICNAFVSASIVNPNGIACNVFNFYFKGPFLMYSVSAMP